MRKNRSISGFKDNKKLTKNQEFLPNKNDQF